MQCGYNWALTVFCEDIPYHLSTLFQDLSRDGDVSLLEGALKYLGARFGQLRVACKPHKISERHKKALLTVLISK